MKFSTVMTVLTIALAFAACGCRYDKPRMRGGAGAEGTTAEAQNIATDPSEVATDPSAVVTEDTGATTGSLDDVNTVGKNFEDIYKPCNDVAFEPVYFGFDSTVVPQGELGKIEAVAAHLTAKPNRVVVVGGHCDDRGSNEYNLSLGENRAIIVRNYLVQSGIAADRIQTRSFGEEKPAVMGADEGAWSKNRRGDFAIFQK